MYIRLKLGRGVILVPGIVELSNLDNLERTIVCIFEVFHSHWLSRCTDNMSLMDIQSDRYVELKNLYANQDMAACFAHLHFKMETEVDNIKKDVATIKFPGLGLRTICKLYRCLD